MWGKTKNSRIYADTAVLVEISCIKLEYAEEQGSKQVHAGHVESGCCSGFLDHLEQLILNQKHNIDLLIFINKETKSYFHGEMSENLRYLTTIKVP